MTKAFYVCYTHFFEIMRKISMVFSKIIFIRIPRNMCTICTQSIIKQKLQSINEKRDQVYFCNILGFKDKIIQMTLLNKIRFTVLRNFKKDYFSCTNVTSRFFVSFYSNQWSAVQLWFFGRFSYTLIKHYSLSSTIDRCDNSPGRFLLRPHHIFNAHK